MIGHGAGLCPLGSQEGAWVSERTGDRGQAPAAPVHGARLGSHPPTPSGQRQGPEWVAIKPGHSRGHPGPSAEWQPQDADTPKRATDEGLAGPVSSLDRGWASPSRALPVAGQGEACAQRGAQQGSTGP